MNKALPQQFELAGCKAHRTIKTVSTFYTPMKIALLNDQLNAGGAEKVLVNMAHLLHHKGVQVILVLFMSPSQLDAQLHPSIPVHYLHRKSKWHLGAMLALRKLVHDCDIVHIHSRYNLRYLPTCPTW